MPNKNYRKGYTFENKLVNEFRKKGCFATRTAGSHSPFDIIAINGKKIFLIQCKANDLSVSEFNNAILKMPDIAAELDVVKMVAFKKDRKTVLMEV